MDETGHADGGLGALRRTADSLLGLAQSRFSLIAVELREEKRRVLTLALWLGVVFILLEVGVLLAAGTLALYAWNVAGYLGLIELALAATASGIGLLLVIRRRSRKAPAPFAATLDEFKKDQACLREEK